MPSDWAAEFRFWRWVGVRLLAILALGFALIVLFRGCVAQLIRDELKQNQQKRLDEAAPK
jgi:hypothetical protein